MEEVERRNVIMLERLGDVEDALYYLESYCLGTGRGYERKKVLRLLKKVRNLGSDLRQKYATEET